MNMTLNMIIIRHLPGVRSAIGGIHLKYYAIAEENVHSLLSPAMNVVHSDSAIEIGKFEIIYCHCHWPITFSDF